MIHAFITPFKDIKIHLGIAGSPWAGFDSFRQLFDDPLFGRALINTATFKLSGALLGGLLAFGLALALHALPWRRVRVFLLALFLIPFFIPSAVLARTVLDLFSTGSPLSQGMLVFGSPALAKLLIIAAVILKTCGIPVALALAAVAASARNPGDGYAKAVAVPALRAVSAFALVQLSGLFTADFDMIYAFANPLILESVMTVDLYMFRMGFLMMKLNLSGAAWLVQFILQLPLFLAAYFLIRRYLSPSLFTAGRTDAPGRQTAPVGRIADGQGQSERPHEPVSPAGQRAGEHPVPPLEPISPLRWIAGTAAVSVYALLIGFLLYRVFVRPFLLSSEQATGLGEWMPAMPFVAFLLFVVLIAMVHLLLTVLLAYPLTARALPGRGVCKAVLLVFLAAGPMLIHHFMYFRLLANTLAPYVLFGLFNLASVFVLKERFNQLCGERKREAERSGRGEAHALVTLFLPNMWRPIIGLGVLQAVALWNSFLIPLIYQSSSAWHSPITVFLQMAFGAGAGAGGFPAGDPAVLQAGALVGLPPLVLFLLFRRFVTADLFLCHSRNL